MEDPYGLSKATIPASYAQLLIEIVVEHGISAKRLLSESQISLAVLSIADGRVTPRQWSRLVWNALELTGDESLGYEYGLRLRPTAHGVLGFALISCSTVGQGLDLASMFFSMRLRDYRIEIRNEADNIVIEFQETHPLLGAAPEQSLRLRRFFHEGMMLGFVHAGRFLTGGRLSEVELWVDWPEPAYHQRYQDRLPHMRFGQSSSQIRMPAANLELPLLMADPLAHQQALRQCEEEQIKHSHSVDQLVARVCAELTLMLALGNPTLDAIATKLHISARTLKRHLHNLGTSYIQLLDIVRRQEAEKLLKNTETEIQEISSLLGYLEPANFTRAFKRWSGETPRKYRQRTRS